jgi:hypothetical protein
MILVVHMSSADPPTNCDAGWQINANISILEAAFVQVALIVKRLYSRAACKLPRRVPILSLIGKISMVQMVEDIPSCPSSLTKVYHSQHVAAINSSYRGKQVLCHRKRQL